MGVPLAGCQSHRLQLGVYDFLGPEEKKNAEGVIIRHGSRDSLVIRKLDLLMSELKTAKNAATLKTGFQVGEIIYKPQRRIKAKWASLFEMLLKWEKLRIPIARINQFPLSVTEHIPNQEEKVGLCMLINI